MSYTIGSLFAGIGGFDLGFERAGFKTVWQVEKNEFCRALLRKNFVDAEIHEDIRGCATKLSPVGVIAGGDPCPKHSRARSNGDSIHPDLSGYFLAVVGRLRPRWVVRENVPSPTVAHFSTCLEMLGYGSIVIRFDAAEITGQSRQRDFIVAANQADPYSIRKLFPEFKDGQQSYTTRLGTRKVIPALTTHRTRYDSRDCYVWHKEQGLRILDCDERCSFAGFPKGWADGFSPATQARMFGNAVVPQIPEMIARRIKQVLEAA
jgi:site-specific DNA-cytosine methylase